MDDRKWATNILLDIRFVCLIQINFDVSLWIVDGDTVKLPQNILDASCLNDCNNNGACKAGIRYIFLFLNNNWIFNNNN